MTSPDTVRWSSSSTSGILPNLIKEELCKTQMMMKGCKIVVIGSFTVSNMHWVLGKPGEEGGNFLEVVFSKLDQGGRREHSLN